MNVTSYRRFSALLGSEWTCLACRNAISTRRDVGGVRKASSRGTTALRSAGGSHEEKVISSKNPRTGFREAILPKSPVSVKTRFAPSPTGYLHIGGLRTALFSYLLARRCNGKFVLRIEDTDQKRLVSDAEQRLIEDLQWAGLEWDEGPVVQGEYGPYRQSERTAIYQTHSRHLLDKEAAYRCFCKPQSTATYSTSACYQNCSTLSRDESLERAEAGQEPFTVRLITPADAHKRIYSDLVYKRIPRLKRSPSASLTASESELEGTVADSVLMKSDGTPTYHFANVVDDHLMEITHVIRGEEWLASTPLHYDIYSAFGWQPPDFAHVGLLLDENRAKLSKRSGSLGMDVRSMREQQGVLPVTLNNFLVLLGWQNPTNDDVMTMEDLIRTFDLKFTKGGSMVKMEKLWFLQKQHFAKLIQTAEAQHSVQPVQDILENFVREVKQRQPGFVPPEHFSLPQLEDLALQDPLTRYCAAILLADTKNFKTLENYVERARHFFERPTNATEETQPPTEAATASDNNRDGDPGALAAALMASRAIRTSSNGFPLKPPSTPIDLNSIKRGFENAMTNSIAAEAARIFERDQPDFIAMKHSRALDFERSNVEDRDQFQRELRPLEDLQATLKKPLLHYLRKKLCGGLPGPGMVATMAILGYEECCVRLGVPAAMPKTSSVEEEMAATAKDG